MAAGKQHPSRRGRRCRRAGPNPPAAPLPADFDKFWKAKLKELKKVPMDPVLEKVDIGKPRVAYWKITMDNIRGTHIEGQIARPEKGKKFPALLIVQWAGVYGLQTNWVTDRAAEGWLALDIEPHDLPIDKPAAFYRNNSPGCSRIIGPSAMTIETPVTFCGCICPVIARWNI